MLQESELREPDLFVVCRDLDGIHKTGQLVRKLAAHYVNEHGGAALPCMPKMFAVGCGGYVQRQWGEGISLANNTPRFYSPLAMFVSSTMRTINWALELKHVGEESVNGFIQLTTDSSQPHAQSGRVVGQRAVLSDDLFRESDTVVLKGTATIDSSHDGFCGMGFYSHSSGVLLLWSAVTQTP
jgi:hypothetical protein